MQCARCQHENPSESNFCLGCGTRLGLRCASCSSDLPAGSRFCNKCGQPVQATSEARFATPDSYTPKHLAEKILTSKSALEGERKQVTVLFADLRGSMELLADRDPEEARKLLDPVLERMIEAVHHYEGTVNQVMGDGIMALFGAPIGHEDHAVRACYAALRMQQRVSLYADELRQKGGTPVQVRVGLNSGAVVVGSIGSDLRMVYTAVGHTTHLAARMEQMATPGSVLITPYTLRLAEGRVEVRSLGPLAVKGLSQPVDVYELVSTSPVRTRLEVAAARGLTRFIGRDAELEQLRHARDQVGAGRGQLVAVVGEPGVGKSRLVWEFMRSLAAQGWRVLECRCASYGRTSPYLPVIDLLRTYFKIQDRDGYREIRERVASGIHALDAGLAATIPALLTLLDVHVDDPTWDSLDPPRRRQRILDAVCHLLFRESQVEPLLLVFEDLHWIDTETQALLDTLVTSLPTARVLLVVNYRPEYKHQWGSRTYYSQLRLNSLPPPSATELLHLLVGEDPSVEPLERLLVQRTDGNPFFLEESVRTLVESRILVGEPGAYRLSGPTTLIHVPATVQAVLAARIDRLPSPEKALLQTASVIGKDVPFALLRAISEGSEDELRHHLTQLQATEFLYETGSLSGLEYTFKHALTHEVTYESLTTEHRRRLHAAIVASIERLYSERLEEHTELLAHHAISAATWDKAVHYSRQAGAKAFARSANREAVVYFEQALAALQHLPESRERMEWAIDLRFDLRNPLQLLGEFGRILDHMKEARTLAEAIDQPLRRGWVDSFMSQCFRLTGELDRAIEAGRQALTVADALGDFELRVATDTHLGPAYAALGDYRQATEILRRSIASLTGDLARQRFRLAGFPAVGSRSNLVCCLAELGEFDEAAVLADQALRLAESIEDPYSLTFACFGAGTLSLLKGEFNQTIEVLERGLERCRHLSLPLMFPPIASSLGSAYAWSGRAAHGVVLLEQAVAQATAMQLMIRYSLFLVRLGEGLLLAGRPTDASKAAERACQLARDKKERGYEAYALHLLGQIAASRNAPVPEVAEELVRQALAIARDLGMRPLSGRCHLTLGMLHRKNDRPGDAEQHLTTAVDLFRELEMPFWHHRGEAELHALA
jgi:class 3 adenylate cyclase/tetratricopeptide (TPR) repeat protein